MHPVKDHFSFGLDDGLSTHALDRASGYRVLYFRVKLFQTEQRGLLYHDLEPARKSPRPPAVGRWGTESALKDRSTARIAATLERCPWFIVNSETSGCQRVNPVSLRRHTARTVQLSCNLRCSGNALLTGRYRPTIDSPEGLRSRPCIQRPLVSIFGSTRCRGPCASYSSGRCRWRRGSVALLTDLPWQSW